MSPTNIREEMYKTLSDYFRKAMELTGKCSLEMGKVIIPDQAIYQARDKAIEYVESLLSSHTQEVVEKIEKMRGEPDSYSYYVSNVPYKTGHEDSSGFNGHWEEVGSWDDIPKKITSAPDWFIKGATRKHWHGEYNQALQDVLTILKENEYDK